MSIAPRGRTSWHDAYDEQMALWRFYRSQTGRHWMIRAYHREADGLQYESTRVLISQLYAAELGRLIDCDPIYISPDMCEVVAAALEGFNPEPLLETDLMTPRGFMYYANPIVIPDKYENATPISAVSWTRTFYHETDDGAAGMNSVLTMEDSVGDAEAKFDELGARAAGIGITLYQRASDSAHLVPMHLTPWYFGMTFDGNELDDTGTHTGAEWWWRAVQVTFRLMQQRLAVRRIERHDRATRREGKRLGFQDEHDVVVVRLRREESERREEESEPGNWSHRWIVTGHWRNAWYPSEGIHRQIWISAFVKGPEDKPLIVRPRRVFTWSR